MVERVLVTLPRGRVSGRFEPQVMVRIDNRQTGIERLFRR
jgi:hypothetical protein